MGEPSLSMELTPRRLQCCIHSIHMFVLESKQNPLKICYSNRMSVQIQQMVLRYVVMTLGGMCREPTVV